jgi:antitoxin (DNA-binding transcriptional repressor) of toxin-antitoxin stability system
MSFMAHRRQSFFSFADGYIITCMAKHVIHISELEAARHFTELVTGLRTGEEIVIEDDSHPVAVVQAAEPAVRLLSESLRIARERGADVTLDEDFARDVEAGIASRQYPSTTPC